MIQRFVLASNSPRRRELLSGAGFIFDTARPAIREHSDINLTARELTALNAMQKGLAFAREHPSEIVLSADTLVSLDHQVIGKPYDFDHAAKILRRLSGKVHQVWSSVFIVQRAEGRSLMFNEVSRVRFRRLDDRMITAYLAKVDPLDKAGAYAAQGCGAEIIAAIEGSYTNVVGLPMEKTVAALADFGIKPSLGPRSKC